MAALVGKTLRWEGRPSTLSRPVVFGLPALGMIIAFVPMAAMIRRPYLMVFVAASMLVSIWLEHDDKTYVEIRDHATARPDVREVTLAGVKALLGSTLTALFSIAVFYAATLLVHIVNSVFGLSWDRGDIAFITAMAVSFPVVVVFYAVGVDDVGRALYPLTAGFSSGWYELSRRTVVFLGVLAATAVVCAVELAVLLLPVPHSTVIIVSLAFQCVLFVISAAIAPQTHEPVLDPPAQATIEAATAAFGILNYERVAFPRTQRADIDPLLLDVDLLAYSPDRTAGLAVDIKQGASHTPVDWQVCASLVTAARAIESVMEEGAHVHPVVILVDVPGDDSFRSFARNEDVAVVVLDTETSALDVTGGPPGTDLQGAALRLLQAVARPQAASGPPATDPAATSA